MSEGRLPALPRNSYRAFRTLTTRWLDNDIYGHMNNAVHYSLFDTAVNAWLIERGTFLYDPTNIVRTEMARTRKEALAIEEGATTVTLFENTNSM